MIFSLEGVGQISICSLCLHSPLLMEVNRGSVLRGNRSQKGEGGEGRQRAAVCTNELSKRVILFIHYITFWRTKYENVFGRAGEMAQWAVQA